MIRVLIDNFAAIVRLGLADLLVEAGCEVLDGTSDGGRVGEHEPDVVLVDLDQPGRRDHARRLSIDHPSVLVIGLASEGARTRIFPAWHCGESYETTLSPAQLVLAATGRPPA